MASSHPPVEFGVIVEPLPGDPQKILADAARYEAAGIDRLCVYDHPYWPQTLECLALSAALLAKTDRILVQPCVLNLQVRNDPALMAKYAATLDVLFPGRVELGVGAGSRVAKDDMLAMGAPDRTPDEAHASLLEAIEVIRLCWSGGEKVSYGGTYYPLDDYRPGPAPATTIPLVVGAYRHRALDVIGRLGDAWIPSLIFATPDKLPAYNRRIDAAAEAAGRSPGDIRRMYNLGGRIADGPVTGVLEGPVEHWVELLTELVVDYGMDAFQYGFGVSDPEQLDRFANEVAPAVRAAVTATPEA